MARPTSTRRFIAIIEEALGALIGEVKDDNELEDLLSVKVNACTGNLEYVSDRIYYHSWHIVGDFEISKQHPLFRIEVEKEVSKRKQQQVITAIEVVPVNEDILDYYLHEYICEMEQLEILSELNLLERREDYMEDGAEREAVQQRIKLLNNMLI